MNLKKINIPNEVKYGILFTITLVMFIIGFKYLKGTNVFKVGDEFYVECPRINGMQESAAVLLNGFKVGLVDEIKLKSSDSDILIAHITMFEDYDVPLNSVARIHQEGLIGSMIISIIPSQEQKFHKSGDFLKFEIDEGFTSQLDPLKAKAESLIGTLDSILISVNTMLSSSFVTDVQKTVESLNSSLAAVDDLLNNPKSDLNRSLKNITTFSQSLENSSDDLENVLANFSTLTDSINVSTVVSVIDNAEKTLKSVDDIMAKINAGDGSVGQLINNDSLYINIENVAGSLDELLIDIEANPKKYVHFSLFGRKNK